MVIFLFYSTVYDLEYEPPITPAETVVHTVPDAAAAPYFSVCILMNTATVSKDTKNKALRPRTVLFEQFFRTVYTCS